MFLFFYTRCGKIYKCIFHTQDQDNSDEEVRKRNLELEAENDRLRKELKKAKVREERTRKEKMKVLQQLKDANQLNEELQLKLSSYSKSDV